MKKIKKKRDSKWDTYYILPILFAVSLIPLIVRLVLIPITGIAYEIWGIRKDADYNAYFKSVWTIIFASALVIAFLIKRYKNQLEIRKTPLYLPLAAYGLLTIISTLASEYGNIALFGFKERYEGMFVLLSYLILMFGVINFIEEEKQIKIFTIFLSVSAAVIGIIVSKQ